MTENSFPNRAEFQAKLRYTVELSFYGKSHQVSQFQDKLEELFELHFPGESKVRLTKIIRQDEVSECPSPSSSLKPETKITPSISKTGSRMKSSTDASSSIPEKTQEFVPEESEPSTKSSRRATGNGSTSGGPKGQVK